MTKKEEQQRSSSWSSFKEKKYFKWFFYLHFDHSHWAGQKKGRQAVRSFKICKFIKEGRYKKSKVDL